MIHAQQSNQAFTLLTKTNIEQILMVFTEEFWSIIHCKLYQLLKNNKNRERIRLQTKIHCRCSINQSKMINTKFVKVHALNYINILATSKQ